MKMIKLDIYSLQTMPIAEGVRKNWLKGGRLSKNAVTTKGSFLELLRDGENPKEWKFADLEKFGYTNIKTGYVDNVLYLSDAQGEQYIGYLSMKMSNWDNFISLGFSSHK